MPKKCYKVVRTEGKDFVSAHATNPKFTLKYPIGETVSGVNGSPIFVFKLLRDARNWGDMCRGNGLYEILDCTYEEKYPVQGYMTCSAYVTLDGYTRKVMSFWKKMEKRDPIQATECVPGGTILVKSVKVIKVHGTKTEP